MRVLSVDIRLRLGDFQLAAAFSVDSQPLVLFGYSGSGKSTTLEAIAGLRQPDHGRIVLNGKTLFDAASGLLVPAHRREIGYLVQDGALFPHMTVAQNIGFALKDAPAGERQRQVSNMLDLLDLGDLADRRPSALSGGQRQRTALARALSRRAQLLLLDEPFAALDQPVRSRILQQLISLHQELALTMVYVTHDLGEAFMLGGQMAVYDAGEILQIGSSNDIYARPVTRRTALLTGTANVLAAKVVAASDRGLTVRLGRWELQTDHYPFAIGDPVCVCVRPQAVILLRRDRPSRNPENLISGRIIRDQLRGSLHTLQMEIDGDPPPLRLEIELPAHAHTVMGVRVGSRWRASLRRAGLHLIDDSREIRAQR